MSNRLALPMYAVDRADTDALEWAVRAVLMAHGVPVGDFSPGEPETDLLTHWRQPVLILSQTCGYPLVTQLPDVQVVGCFHYAAPGCAGSHYRSFLVVREEDKHLRVDDFRGRRVVCNAPDSHSGYNVLRKRVAPQGVNGYFSQVMFSGSHRQSLIEVKRGRGDITAIDCVTYALLQRHQPGLLEGLTAIDQTPLTPGLPLITSHETPPETLHAIRAALASLVSAPEYGAICHAALIKGFSSETRQSWLPLLD